MKIKLLILGWICIAVTACRVQENTPFPVRNYEMIDSLVHVHFADLESYLLYYRSRGAVWNQNCFVLVRNANGDHLLQADRKGIRLYDSPFWSSRSLDVNWSEIQMAVKQDTMWISHEPWFNIIWQKGSSKWTNSTEYSNMNPSIKEHIFQLEMEILDAVQNRSGWIAPQ